MYSAGVVQVLPRRRRALMMRSSRNGGPSEVDNDQLRAIIKADPLKTTWEVVKGLNVDHSTFILNLKQIEKVKKLDKWLPHELTADQKKKNHYFEVSSSFILHNSKSFLNQIVTCDKKWILYDNQRLPAWWLDWGAASKHVPKPNLHQKKVMVTVWWSAAALIHHSFLNPGWNHDIWEMLRKLMRYTKNCNVCT